MNNVVYVREIQGAKSMEVSNNGSTWCGLVPSEETPTRLWLRIPDESEGVMKLMEYDWTENAWNEVS